MAPCKTWHRDLMRSSGPRAVAQRRRDPRRGFLDAIEPRFLEAVGGCGDGQAGHEAALVVVDAGGHAAYAQLELLVVARDRGLADLVELAFEHGQVGEAVAGVAGQARARRV